MMLYTFIRTHARSIVVSMSVIIIFLLGCLFGGYVEISHYKYFLLHSGPVRQNPRDLKYVNPLLGVDTPDATTVDFFTSLKKQLEQTVEKYQDTQTIEDASIYFRDLNTSFWFGINENANYVTASLLKLPIALAAYREGEDDPSFFSEKLYYTYDIAAINKKAANSSSTRLVVGSGYSVRDLVAKMLTESDNGAKDLLAANISKHYMDDIFNFAALIEPDFARQYNSSPKNYSIFFRVLYSSTYLSDKDSNELLEILTHTKFVDGLVGGTPSATPVSHKFGYHILSQDTDTTPGSRELHDCGIVYHPRHPYILCIMTKGSNESSLKTFIADISRVVYKNADDDYGAE